jgi:hypothetical protein
MAQRRPGTTGTVGFVRWSQWLGAVLQIIGAVGILLGLDDPPAVMPRSVDRQRWLRRVSMMMTLAIGTTLTLL